MSRTKSWSLQTILLVFCSLIGISILTGYLWMYFGWSEGNTWDVVASYAIQLLLSIGAFWWFAVRGRKLTKADFSWRWQKPELTIAYVVGGLVLNIVLQAIVKLILNLSSLEVPGFEQQSSHIALFGDSPLGFAMLIIIALGIAPAFEELFFRGFILRVLSERFRPWIAVCVTSVAFAGLHFEFSSFFSLFILSSVMGFLFLKTKSLPTAICFHLANNALAIAAEYAVYHHILPVPF